MKYVICSLLMLSFGLAKNASALTCVRADGAVVTLNLDGSTGDPVAGGDTAMMMPAPEPCPDPNPGECKFSGNVGKISKPNCVFNSKGTPSCSGSSSGNASGKCSAGCKNTPNATISCSVTQNCVLNYRKNGCEIKIDTSDCSSQCN